VPRSGMTQGGPSGPEVLECGQDDLSSSVGSFLTAYLQCPIYLGLYGLQSNRHATSPPAHSRFRESMPEAKNDGRNYRVMPRGHHGGRCVE